LISHVLDRSDRSDQNLQFRQAWVISKKSPTNTDIIILNASLLIKHIILNTSINYDWAFLVLNLNLDRFGIYGEMAYKNRTVL